MKIHSMAVSVPPKPNGQLCNAKCPFCISRLTGKAQKWNTGKISWQKKLEKACGFAQNNGVSTLFLTGKGEPFLNLEDCYEILSIGSKYFSIMEIQTNGSLCTESNLTKLMEQGLTTLAISISHPNPTKNAALIGLDEVVDYHKISKIANNLGLVIRISFNISNFWEDNDMSVMDWVKKILSDTTIDVHQYTFRKLGLPPSTDIPEYSRISKWIKKYMITDKQINDYIKKHGTFLRQLNWGATIYDVNGFSVAIVECLQKPGYSEDEIRSIIFMPNGHVYTSWEKTGSILF